MHSELISDLVHHLDYAREEDLRVGNCDKRLSDEIESWDIPMDLKRLLQWSWFNDLFVGGHDLNSVAQIVDDRDRQRFMSDRLLGIGSCANGDMIAVDFREDECPVRFVSHDILWESETRPRECSVLIFKSLAEFLLRIVEDKFIPIDYDSGCEFRHVVDEMAK